MQEGRAWLFSGEVIEFAPPRLMRLYSEFGRSAASARIVRVMRKSRSGPTERAVLQWMGWEKQGGETEEGWGGGVDSRQRARSCQVTPQSCIVIRCGAGGESGHSLPNFPPEDLQEPVVYKFVRLIINFTLAVFRGLGETSSPGHKSHDRVVPAIRLNSQVLRE